MKKYRYPEFTLVLERSDISDAPRKLVPCCCGDSLTTLSTMAKMTQGVKIVKILDRKLESEAWTEEYIKRVPTDFGRNHCLSHNREQINAIVDYAQAWSD